MSNSEESWTVMKVLKWTEGRFRERGIPTARLDAELLLSHALSWNRVKLYTHFDQPMQSNELAACRALIQRRLKGDPVAYIVGKKEFRSLELAVDARVLIPRPDTEALVDELLDGLEGAVRIVDIGTGSGAIAIAAKRALPDATVVAIDVSPDAAAVAQQNAVANDAHIEVRTGDLLAPLAKDERFDVIVSNPPYIPTADIAGLAIEVKQEPMLALDGGKDGLDVVRRLVANAPAHLVDGGKLALEIGHDQAERVVALFAADGRYQPAVVRRDLAGIARVVSARRAS